MTIWSETPPRITADAGCVPADDLAQNLGAAVQIEFLPDAPTARGPILTPSEMVPGGVRAIDHGWHRRVGPGCAWPRWKVGCPRVSRSDQRADGRRGASARRTDGSSRWRSSRRTGGRGSHNGSPGRAGGKTRRGRSYYGAAWGAIRRPRGLGRRRCFRNPRCPGSLRLRQRTRGRRGHPNGESERHQPFLRRA
jgi:hypothetical protein